MVAKTRQTLHRLIDELPESRIDEARRLLGRLRYCSGKELRQALANAPLDDEALTDEDVEAIREAEEAIARGEVIPWEEYESRLGDKS